MRVKLTVLLYGCGFLSGIAYGQEARTWMYGTAHLNDCTVIQDDAKMKVIQGAKKKAQILFEARFKIPLEWDECERVNSIFLIKVQNQPLASFSKKHKILFEPDDGTLIFSYSFFEQLAKDKKSSVEVLLGAAIERALVADLVGARWQSVWSDEDIPYVVAGFPQFDASDIRAAQNTLRLH
jgi:hypothetical protein